ncbi:HAD-IA family hydrolase [Glaciecola sp. XM2]|jgi:phosphoglycolate phosphatase|uniref:HAD family hydrolase n=1 Tax=Glaciecola sp. XM2 TaxID=1914931 RepID=UPI001BDF539F|nr:HAD-IA family hydrolase [Glaciecola sp. XM2]MBT1449703.1 HAD-IA family hydrolase [Glaciecola sp. XM2]
MRYSHIIFDWDGTVMDSAAKIVSCMQLAAIKTGLPVPSSEAVEHIIGISLRPAIAQLFAIDLERAEVVASHYKQIFIEQDQTPSPLFDGAIDTLNSLKESHVLGVATGKARRGLERAWSHSDTKHYFSASRCADEAESKPSSDMLIQLIDAWQVPPESVLMVGDTVYDMQMAQNIGMPRLGVSYGVHSSESLLEHQPVGVIDEFSEILNYI